MSTRFQSLNFISIREINGKEYNKLESEMPKMCIREHWNIKRFVVIEIDGVKYTVLADELIRAINNAQNAHSF